MKKYRGIIVVILATLIASMTITACSGESKEFKNRTEAEIVAKHMEVLEFLMEDKTLEPMSSYVSIDDESGYNTLFMDVDDVEGFDYEGYKEKIWEAVDMEFNIIFNRIPFPSAPSISGIIRQIDVTQASTENDRVGSILIVQQPERFSYSDNDYVNASQVTVSADTIIVNTKGDELTFESLKAGMYVDSYNRGMILESYPTQQGTEKLVVDEDYELPITEGLLGPFPMILLGYRDEHQLNTWKSELIFYMDQGEVYYDQVEGFQAPKRYIGNLNWTLMTPDNDYLTGTFKGVYLEPNQSIELKNLSEDEYQFYLTIIKNDVKEQRLITLNKAGEMTE